MDLGRPAVRGLLAATAGPLAERGPALGLDLDLDPPAVDDDLATVDARPPAGSPSSSRAAGPSGRQEQDAGPGRLGRPTGEDGMDRSAAFEPQVGRLAVDDDDPAGVPGVVAEPARPARRPRPGRRSR